MTPPPDLDALTWGYSRDAEQAVIGGLLLDNAAWENVADIVRPEHFHSTDHRLIFDATCKLIEGGHSADALTVADKLQALGKLEDVGGMVYLGGLAINTPSAANVAHYAEIVRDRATMRALYAEAMAVADACRRPAGRGPRELVDQAQARFMGLGERAAGSSDFMLASDVMSDVTEFIDQQAQRYAELGEGAAVTGLATGFHDLDRMTSGLHPGQLVVVAARPAMGKSALTLNICEHIARAGTPALFFSLEMGNREQGIRLVASRSGLNTQRLFSGRISESEWPRIVDGIGQISSIPLLFNDSPYLTVQEMRSLGRRAKRQHPKLGVIVVDYLQLMVAGTSEQNRANQIAEISRGLKLLAKELEMPVIALSQLNRELEKRTNKRPVLSDLRDSGAIEQDADMVVFIYRDEVYHPVPADHPDKGRSEIIIAKQRNGPTGTVELLFRGDNTRFVNYQGRA